MEPLPSTFTVTRADQLAAPIVFVQQGLVIGRLPSCNVVLNHPTVSRIHAGINKLEGEFYLINLSVSNTLTINGRVIAAEQADILADGDAVQIGPFTLLIERAGESLSINITYQVTGNVTTGDLPQQAVPKKTSGRLGSGRLSSGRLQKAKTGTGRLNAANVGNVLKVFWEKRTREKAERLSPLHPREKPLPGKTRINWRPTGDLMRPWPFSIFFWAIVLLGGLAILAAYKYSTAFAPAPLSSAHARPAFTRTGADAIANRPNANSCTTCHKLNEPVVNACAGCHQTEAFYADTTEAHAAAGLTCTTCHMEHKGTGFQPRAAAFDSCAACHNDNNQQLYNGKRVFTPHGADLGYPVQNEEWIWKGLSEEEISVLPEIAAQRNEKDTEQTWRSKQFHSLHLYRVKIIEGVRGNKEGQLSCSSCHQSFDPIDRQTPRTTCSQCHQGYVYDLSITVLFDPNRINCTSCHVQHAFDARRWGSLLTTEARSKRAQAIAEKIRQRIAR
jgi:hypothetical protein